MTATETDPAIRAVGSRSRLSGRQIVVLVTAAALIAALVASTYAWKLGGFSLIRLLHWWLVFVQGNDSWMPMRAAYEWHAAGNAEPIYRRVLFDQHIKFQYPPASLLVFWIADVLHLARTNHALNLVGWFSVLGEAVLTAALSWLGTARWRQLHWRLALVVLTFGATLTFYPVLWGYKEGQIQAWLSCWFVLSALCFFTGRKRASGALIGAICIAKPQFLLFLAWGLLRREWGFSGAAAVVIAATTIAAIALFGWDNHLDYLAALSFMSEHGEAFVRNYSVNGVMHRLLGNGYALEFVPRWYAPYHPVVYWTTVATSAVMIGIMLFFRRREPANLMDFFIAALSLTMASPIAWEHHYGILPPMFVMLALTFSGSGRRAIAAAAALFAAFLACDIILPPIKALISGPGSLLQATVFFGALTVLVLLYRWRDAFTRSLKSDENPLAIKQVAEQPAHQGVGEGA